MTTVNPAPGSNSSATEAIEKTNKFVVWWDRVKITVIGLSILVSVLSTAYFLGSTQSTIITKLETVSSDLEELKTVVDGLSVEQKAAMSALSALSERVSKLETFRETQIENTRLFWAKDWSALIHRLELVERGIFRGPEFKERPPGK